MAKKPTKNKTNKTDKTTTKAISVEVKRKGQERTEIAKAMFLEIFLKKACNISMACASAGINRATYYAWIAKDKVFRKSIEEQKEALIDYVESKMFERIYDGDPTLIKFHLERKARHRGYGEKTETAVDIQITHKYIKEIADKPKRKEVENEQEESDN